MRKKTFTPTIFKLSEIEDTQVRSNLEMKYSEFIVSKSLFVEKQRKAEIEMLKAKKLQMQAQIEMLEFIENVSQHSETVQTEPFWIVYSKNGEICLENIFTEQDARNTLRLQKAQLNKQVENDLGNDDLYEQEGE